jgi:hypothetical protein
MSEQTIFQDNNILITNERIVVNETTYLIKEIKSVNMSDNRMDIPGWSVFYVLISGLIVRFLVYGGEFNLDAIIWISLSILAFSFFQLVVFLKNRREKFYLTIKINDNWQTIINSTDHFYIYTLLGWVNKAMLG